MGDCCELFFCDLVNRNALREGNYFPCIIVCLFIEDFSKRKEFAPSSVVLHLITLQGYWGTTDGFATIYHLVLLAALVELAKFLKEQILPFKRSLSCRTVSDTV